MPMIRYRKIIVSTTIEVYDQDTGDLISEHTEVENSKDNGTLDEDKGLVRTTANMIQVVAVRSTRVLNYIAVTEKERGH